MEQSVALLGILGSDAAREKARALPLWGAPLFVRKPYADAELRDNLRQALGLVPEPSGGAVLGSPEAVAYWPVVCVKSPAVLRALLERCRALDAEAEMSLPADWPFETATSLSAPAGEPALRITTAFDERAIWVDGESATQTWAVLGTVVERIDLTAQGATRKRLPVPAFGSPELSAWLAKSDFFLIDPELAAKPQRGAFPWGSGLLFSRRRGEQPGGLFWLGALDRANLPPITAGMLAFEDESEAFPVAPSGQLALVEWPRLSYCGEALEAVGAWHDWKLILRTAPSGIWTYATLSERLDFLAGDLLTWLETLAHDEALTAEKRLPIELGMLLGEAPQSTGSAAASGAGARLAAALGLAPDPLHSDPLHASFASEQVWLRVLAAPLGHPFLVARCATVDAALDAVDAALAAGSPRCVALSTWSASQPELRSGLTARGCEVISSGRMWWGDLDAAARR